MMIFRYFMAKNLCFFFTYSVLAKHEKSSLKVKWESSFLALLRLSWGRAYDLPQTFLVSGGKRGGGLRSWYTMCLVLNTSRHFQMFILNINYHAGKARFLCLIFRFLFPRIIMITYVRYFHFDILKYLY